jgi:glutamate-5-semialdehyde dehydrogenase
MTLTKQLETIAQQAKQAADYVAQMSNEKKSAVLLAMAASLEQHMQQLLASNALDVAQAKNKDCTAAFIDRLTLTEARIEGMANSMRTIAQLPDPVGQVLKSWDVASGLHIEQVSVPLGVILMIYEARPNVTSDATALCIKSGNAVILRGGSDCMHTNQQIVTLLTEQLKKHDVDDAIIQYVPTKDRQAVEVLLQLDDYIDVVIPRGGKALISRIKEQSKIPLFQHLDGICHTYVHTDADMTMAKNIVLNAKLRRTGICGATETLLVDQAIADRFLPSMIDELLAANCEVRGEACVQAYHADVIAATENDWSTEYLDAIISIKIINSLDEAIKHINAYGSHHTDAIITMNKTAAREFSNRVNSAIVMHNCSTQFADGGEFGMGAEIGIATGKLHARGPVGVNQLTTFKYRVAGSGQTRAQ